MNRLKHKDLGYKVTNPGLGLGMLALTFFLLLIVVSLLAPLLLKVIHRPEASLRIIAVLQDLLLFIIPAVAAALVASRLPARLLGVDHRPDWGVICGAIGVLLVAMPAMNFVIEWNQQIHLPESMASIEHYFRQLEDSAGNSVNVLMGGSSIGALIVSLLIVAVLAGFSEEIFFRGALQRILMASNLNHHVVIWLVAIVFSVFHFQFFGFFPRMLLGAFFGYLIWWSGSLWIPMAVHIFNNSMVVLATWRTGEANGGDEGLAAFGSDMSDPYQIIGALLSLFLTVVGLYLLRKFIKQKKNLPSVGEGGAD